MSYTYQINVGRKFKYLFKTTAQCTVHLIISLYVLLGNNLQHYKAFTCNRKCPRTVNKHCRRSQCNCSKPQQESKFNCLVFVRSEKQRFRRFADANFSLGEIILIGQFFAVRLLGEQFHEYFMRLPDESLRLG